MNLLATILAFAIALGATESIAESTSYSTVEAVAAVAMRIGYHATATKDCKPGSLPTVRMVEPPKFGTVTVRPAILTTNKVAGCPNFKTPAQTVLYQSRVGYVGKDHVVYEVSSANGAIATFDITVEVKAGPPPPAKGKDTDL